jgi:hypothetical protein
MSIIPVLDATHKNVGTIPANMQAALYTTGSSDIKATAADFKAHPNAIHICQDHGSDVTADMLDMETGAATPHDAILWLPKARAAFNTNARPGQRWPGIYAQQSRITEMANALVTAHDNNVPLWIAHWGVSQVNATNEIVTTSGPFPVVGMQIANQVTHDFSLFSTTWLNRTSLMPTAIPAIPPGQWKNPNEFTWKEVVEIGIGLDGKMHAFFYDNSKNIWKKIA